MADIEDLPAGTIVRRTGGTRTGIVVDCRREYRGNLRPLDSIRVRWFDRGEPEEVDYDPDMFEVVLQGQAAVRATPARPTVLGFSVGDRVRHRHDPEIRGTVTFVNEAAGTLTVSDGDPPHTYSDRYVDFEPDPLPQRTWDYEDVTITGEPLALTVQPEPTPAVSINPTPEAVAVLNALCLSDPPPEIRLALAVLMGDMESAGPLADRVAESRQVAEGTR